MYTHSSSLAYQQGDCTVIIPSEEGIHKGDPFGLAVFSTNIHSILTELQSSLPFVRVLAYLDDVFLVGLEEDVLSSLDSLRPAFSNIGLQISFNKCEIYFLSWSLRSCRSNLNDISVTLTGRFLGLP